MNSFLISDDQTETTPKKGCPKEKSVTKDNENEVVKIQGREGLYKEAVFAWLSPV